LPWYLVSRYKIGLAGKGIRCADIMPEARAASEKSGVTRVKVSKY